MIDINKLDPRNSKDVVRAVWPHIIFFSQILNLAFRKMQSFDSSEDPCGVTEIEK